MANGRVYESVSTTRPTARMARERVAELRTRTRGRTLGDRYELRRVLGEGGMAEVHLATDLLLERDVAVKVLRRNLALDPVHLERFRREALALAAVDSPHVVAALDVGVDGADHYLVMRYVRGQSLGEMLARRGTLPRERAVAIAADVLAGLEALHAKNLIHRDIKADNVLVEWDGRVTITDLGVAADRARPQLTSPETTLGTVAMMPPEQRASGHVDRRTDVFQVGLLLLHMLTGESPDAGDVGGITAQLALVDAAVAAVVRRALDANIERRWSSAAEMRQALVTARPAAVVAAVGQPPAPVGPLAVGSDESRTRAPKVAERMPSLVR